MELCTEDQTHKYSLSQEQLMRNMAIKMQGYLKMMCVLAEVCCPRLITALNKGGVDLFVLSSGLGWAIAEFGNTPCKETAEKNSGLPLAKKRGDLEKMTGYSCLQIVEGLHLWTWVGFTIIYIFLYVIYIFKLYILCKCYI